MANITKVTDLPNFKQLEAMALEVGRMLSESRELCETMAAWHLQLEQRYPGQRERDPSFDVITRLVKEDPFYLSRRFTDI